MTNRIVTAGSCLALALVAACGDGGPAAPQPKATAQPADTPADVKFDLSTLQADAVDQALVPSPTEMQRALAKAGIQTRLADMIEERKVAADVGDDNRVAIRTGVILADLMLSVDKASDAQLTSRLAQAKAGFVKLGAGDDVTRTIDDLSAGIANEAVSRDDLVHQLDELAGVMVPEVAFQSGDSVVPLIQAGGWLEGAWLVSGALEQEGRTDAGTSLLRQPLVVAYFMKYVQQEGKDEAPDAVVAKVQQTLETLHQVTSKPTLTADDVKTIHSATGAVLELL